MKTTSKEGDWMKAIAEIQGLKAQRDELLEICKALVSHADKRQLIATVETEDPELNRLNEPEFVKQARAAIAACKASGKDGGK